MPTPQNQVPDDAKPVRDEDAFDVGAVAQWLRANAVEPFLRDLEGVPDVAQFTGGASNLTYVLRYPARDLILRRPPSGTKAAGAHDMSREYLVQSRLKPHFDKVPAMVGLCEDETVIGSPFYVMERLAGPVPRRNLPAGLELTAAQARSLCGTFVDTLAQLHSLDPATTGLSELDRGPGYVERQVSGWSKRCRQAALPDLPDYEDVMAWLAAHQPDDVARVLIHNDFRLDNVVLAADDPTRIVGVLDWEMATVGDPLMDLGGAMAYWVQADDSPEFAGFRRQPSHLPGMLTRREIVETYCAATSREISDQQWRFYEVFGLFRLAVIALQIYYRYAKGQTTNEAYAVFGPATRMLHTRCLALMSSTSLG